MASLEALCKVVETAECICQGVVMMPIWTVSYLGVDAKTLSGKLKHAICLKAPSQNGC